MRGVVQRVIHARITVGEREVARIGRGVLVLIAVEKDDGETDVDYITRKISSLRIFPSPDGRKESDRSVAELDAEICLVPQFTLVGDARRGSRPSYSNAEKPEIAREIFADVCDKLRRGGLRVISGLFQEHMHVEIINDGPFTVILDSRKKM